MKQFKLVLKVITLKCLTCKKEFVSHDGCILCDACIKKNNQINRLLGK